MGKILAVFAGDADLESACLSVGEVGAGADLEILLLSGAPRLDVDGLDLEIGEVAGAALEGAYRDIEGAEELDRVLPQLIEPHLALFGLADDDHLLLLELVDAVNAALLQTVSALLFSEAGRI